MTSAYLGLVALPEARTCGRSAPGRPGPRALRADGLARHDAWRSPACTRAQRPGARAARGVASGGRRAGSAGPQVSRAAGRRATPAGAAAPDVLAAQTVRGA